MTVLAMVMAAASSYLAIERDDSKEVRDALKEHDRQIVRLDRDLLHLAAANARCDRDRRADE